MTQKTFRVNAYLHCIITIMMISWFLTYSIPLSAQNTENPVISFDYDRYLQPSVCVQAKINGVVLPFILDTGSSGDLVLNSWVVTKLNLQFDNSSSATVNNIISKIVNISTFQLISMKEPFNDIKAAVISPSKETKIAGFIGIKLLQNLVFRLDFANKTLTILKDFPASTYGSDSTLVSLSALQDNRYYIPVALSDGTTMNLLVDTGSSYTSIPCNIDIREVSKGRTETILKDPFGNNYFTTEHMFGSIHFGNLIEPNVSVCLESPLRPPRLGLGFLARFRLTFDVSHKRMLFERASNYSAYSDIPGQLSISVQKQNHAFFVLGCPRQSSANKAGMRVGDELLSIGGQSLENRSLIDVSYMLISGKMGDRLDCKVRHSDGETTLIHPILESKFRTEESTMDGAIMQRKSDKSLEIIGVIPRSMSDLSGLRKGDIIRKINGLLTAQTTDEKIFRMLVESDKLSVEVVRKSVLHQSR